MVFGNFSKSIGTEDATKFPNAGENISIKQGNTDLCIDGTALPVATDVYPLHLYNLQSSTDYTIRLDASQFVGNGLVAYLKDNNTNAETLLSGDNTTISFTTKATDAGSYANRYSIVFGASALPVKNITLSVTELRNSQVSVQWRTIGESNIANYQVERSTNGISFTALATVTPSTAHSYSFIDVTHSGAGVYYRIKAVDNVGLVAYSNVVRLNTADRLQLTVYPNPVIGKNFNVDLGSAAAGKYSIILYNKLGQQVYNGVINHNAGGVESINVGSKLATGSYTLNVIGNSQTLKTEIEVK